MFARLLAPRHGGAPQPRATALCAVTRQEDYAVRGKEPLDDEVQVYSWMDATLRELSDLIKEASPAARDRNSQLSFAIVYPGACQHARGACLPVLHARVPGVSCSRRPLSPVQISGAR